MRLLVFRHGHGKIDGSKARSVLLTGTRSHARNRIVIARRGGDFIGTAAEDLL
jgi:hypothetical protein